MKMPQKIMIPIDFSSVAKNAIRYANGILANHEAEVVLIYVNTYDDPRTEKEIKRAYKAFEAEALRAVKFYYEFEILDGNLLIELINASKREETDLVIMGTKAHRASDLSLASALIHSVYCPVIVVPEHFRIQPIRKIAYVNDFRPIQDSEAIKPLWEFALEYDARVYLLHINHPDHEGLLPAEETSSNFDYYLESLNHEYVYLPGPNVEPALNQYLNENKVDLLVILSRDHRCNQQESEGRLISQLTRHVEIPVLALC